MEAFLPHMVYTTGPQLSNICGFLHMPIFLRWTDASPAPLVHNKNYMGNFGKWRGWDVERMRNYTVHCANRCSAHRCRLLELQQPHTLTQARDVDRDTMTSPHRRLRNLMTNSMCLGVAKSLDYALPIDHVDVLLLQVFIGQATDTGPIVATNPLHN